MSETDMIDRLTERCEAYKGQIKAGSDEIASLKARIHTLEGVLRGVRNCSDGCSQCQQYVSDALSSQEEGK